MAEKKDKQECFVIMPITDPDGYEKGHFQHVYQNIIQPACEKTELKPIRADDVKATNLIHVDILKRLLEAPIAICDLSTRNPNVLFELGVRQAFDKPVVLIQEEETGKIFDIAPLRCLNYSKDMKYHDVLKTQDQLKESIKATLNPTEDSVNSMVKMLAISDTAVLPDIQGDTRQNMSMEILQAELSDIRQMMEVIAMDGGGKRRGSIAAVEYERITNQLDRITRASPRVSERKKYGDIMRLMRECDEQIMAAQDSYEHLHFMNLKKRLERALGELGIG